MQISGKSSKTQFQPQAQQAGAAAAAAGPQAAAKPAAAAEAMPAFISGDQLSAGKEALAASRKGSSLEVQDTLRRNLRREPMPGTCDPGGLPYGPLGSTQPKLLTELKVGGGPFDPGKLTELPVPPCPEGPMGSTQ